VPETRPASHDLLIFVEETAEPVEAADAAGVCQVEFREAESGSGLAEARRRRWRLKWS
jgi:hypothetical protein